MAWNKYLLDNGFNYDKHTDEYVKSLGFGRSIRVCSIMKGLFEISKSGKVIFSNFIDTFDEFKEKIEKTLKEQ